MNESSIKAEIARQVERLPLDLQRRLLAIAKELAAAAPKGVRGGLLLQFSGIIDQEEADGWRRAVEDACERVDENGW